MFVMISATAEDVKETVASLHLAKRVKSIELGGAKKGVENEQFNALLGAQRIVTDSNVWRRIVSAVMLIVMYGVAHTDCCDTDSDVWCGAYRRAPPADRRAENTHKELGGAACHGAGRGT
jgi:hypothetical protein